MLTDAELLLGLGRHLSAYEVSPTHAALDSLQFAGQVYEMAWRLRNSQVSTAARIEAIAVEAKIGRRELLREVLPTMQQLGWVDQRFDAGGVLVSVEAFVPPNDVLINDAATLLDILMATPTQRAALELLRATSRQPLTLTAAKQAASQWGDEVAEATVAHLESVNLLRRVEHEVDRPVVFNPNIWTNDQKVVTAALRAEDAQANAEVGALLEEVAAAPGIPEAHVRSTEQRWIDFAVSQGLVERSVVQTSDSEQGFLFSPHLKRDPFGTASSDPSGHVRQLVGSMIYASTFAASYRLREPGAFLYKLIRDGEAGNVPNIGTDYPMLEKAGTVQVVPGSWSGAFRMVLLQSDIAESALEVMDTRQARGSLGDASSLQSLGDQRAYSHLERERAKMAAVADTDDRIAAQLVAALRDVTSGGSFGA